MIIFLKTDGRRGLDVCPSPMRLMRENIHFTNMILEFRERISIEK